MELFTIDELNGMKNADLFEYCKDNGVEIEANNVSKPTKREMISALVAAEKYQDVVEDTNDEVKEDAITVREEIDQATQDETSDADEFLNVGTTNARKRKKSENEKRIEAANKKKAMSVLKRVIITEPNRTQTAISNQAYYCSWGNGVIGHFTDKYILGSEWHVRLGALKNLESATTLVTAIDKATGEMKTHKAKKYNIQYLEPLTKAELELIAKRQVIKESATALQ